MRVQVLVNIILIAFLFLANQDRFLDNMWVFYTIHYFSLFAFIYKEIKKNYFSFLMLFSPILFSFIYLGISFTLGAVFLPLKYGWFRDIIENFVVIKKLNIYTIYVFIVDIILLWTWSYLLKKKSKKISTKEELTWVPFNQSLFVFTLLLFISFNIFPFFDDITLGFSYTFKLILIIYLAIQGFSFSNKLRYLLYVLIIGTIVPYHYHSKREIILVFFILLFLEILKNRYKIKVKLKIKHLLLGVVAALFGIYLVLAASIMRGYGNYDLDSKFDAFLYVPDYIQQPYFKHAFVDNFELTAVLGNSMICMDLIQQGKIPLQYGGTYLKILLSPIPRSLWENKPYGMVLLYSYTYDPTFKDVGQSYPVVHHVEGFANFYWLGIFIAPLMMFFFEKLYWYILNKKHLSILNGKLIISIYVVCTVFQYVRGIGFDTFSLYCLIPIPLVIIYSYLPTKKEL